MELLPIIYLGYMFIAVYFLFVYILLYITNKKELFSGPKAEKSYSISVLVPAFNEEKTIEDTIKTIFRITYPVKEIIVINDGSTDGTKEIVEALTKKFPKLKIINKSNSGKADSVNAGIKIAKGEIVVVVDADSYPAEDSFGKMAGYFNNEKVAAVTCSCFPKNKDKFIERLQDMEYRVIAFTRKLLGYVDAIWVTPGSLTMYRKAALKEIGGFDKDNITEDIEVAWNLAKHGYNREMCISTYVTTTVPNKFISWYKQRRRWNLGGLQCMRKYRKDYFRHGMLGAFILPFFTVQLFLGLLGLGIGVYVLARRLFRDFLFAKYSFDVGTPILTLNNLFITPSFLNYLGLVIFIAGLIFTLLVLGIMKPFAFKKHNPLYLLFYLVVYLSTYPLIMISAIYNFIKKKYEWR
jgi:cellulose synthase/poly-beta-1,6-N-acetylglucosamine synthase-like glycosyltransferase